MTALSESSYTKGQIRHDSTSVRSLEESIHRGRKDGRHQGWWRGEMGSYCLMATVSVLQDEKGPGAGWG